ncbi:MAG: hypothetical protein ACC641_09685 [Acidiferrobacterales bacterium]
MNFEGGKIYHGYGGGASIVTPSGFAVEWQPTDKPAFNLDIVRPVLSAQDTDGYAVLDLSVVAQYADENALVQLRQSNARARLQRGILSDWQFMVNHPDARFSIANETGKILRASDSMGGSRLVQHLSVQSALVLEQTLRDDASLLQIKSMAMLKGVSPRVTANASFKPAELINYIAQTQRSDQYISYRDAHRQFTTNLSSLPVEFSDYTDSIDLSLLAEALFDRLSPYLGAAVLSRSGTGAIQYRIPVDLTSANCQEDFDFAKPFMTSRAIALEFAGLAAVADWAQVYGLEQLVHRRQTSATISTGFHQLTVYSNLPSARSGVVALGADIEFPPQLPARPQPETKTVYFEAPEDRQDITIRLAPTEQIAYFYTPFVVFSNQLTTTTVRGEPVHSNEQLLRLSPAQFPAYFVLTDATDALLQIATIEGTCHYDLDGSEFVVPFTLDSGRNSAFVCVPQEAGLPRVSCVARARDNSGRLLLGEFDRIQNLLDLTSFVEFGSHSVDITCYPPETASFFAIEIMPLGVPETESEFVSVLVFKPETPTITYRWFARSPFAPGFRYRQYQNDPDRRSDWRVQDEWQYNLSIEPASLSTVESEFESLSSVYTSGNGGLESQEVTDVVPVSPAEVPKDAGLYAHPDNPAIHYYVPEYQLATLNVSGSERYLASLARENDTHVLKLRLQKWIPEPLRAQTGEMLAMQHTVAVTLDYKISPTEAIRKRKSFVVQATTDDHIEITLALDSLLERDEIYTVLTDFSYDAKLTIEKNIEVSVPVGNRQNNISNYMLLLKNMVKVPFIYSPLPVNLYPVVPPDQGPVLGSVGGLRNSVLTGEEASRTPKFLVGNKIKATMTLPGTTRVDRLQGKPSKFKLPTGTGLSKLVKPALVLQKKEKLKKGGKAYLRLNFGVKNWKAYSADFFTRSGKYPKCGWQKQSPRLGISLVDAGSKSVLKRFCDLSKPAQLSSLFIDFPLKDIKTTDIMLVLADNANRQTVSSNTVSIADLIQPDVQYEIRRHRFYQPVLPEPFGFNPELHRYIYGAILPGSGVGGLDRQGLVWEDRTHVYYQDTTRPHVIYFLPDSFKIRRTDSLPHLPLVSVRLDGNSTDLSRARATLDYVVAPYVDIKRIRSARYALALNYSAGSTALDFQPLLASNVRFFATVPGATSSEIQDDNAALILQGNFASSMTLGLDELNNLLDAMIDESASQFHGRVEIDVPGFSVETLLFKGHFSDLAGDYFDHQVSRVSDAIVRVSLTNTIESPVSLPSLGFFIERGDGIVQGLPDDEFNGKSVLDVGETFEFQLQFPPDSVVATSELYVNLTGVRSIPVRETIVDAILDPSYSQFYATVTVNIVSGIFSGSGSSTPAVEAVMVTIDGSETIELTSSQRSVDVIVNYPYQQVLKDQAVTYDASYWWTIVYSDGSQTTSPEPVPFSGDSFYVNYQIQ